MKPSAIVLLALCSVVTALSIANAPIHGTRSPQSIEAYNEGGDLAEIDDDIPCLLGEASCAEDKDTDANDNDISAPNTNDAADFDVFNDSEVNKEIAEDSSTGRSGLLDSLFCILRGCGKGTMIH